jgi:DNA-binding HxlR family transcriptional regulator
MTYFYSRYTFMSTPSSRTATPRLARLAELFHHRWAVPVLAELHRGESGGRFAPLARRLGVSRAILAKTLAVLGALGLARRNPGYGHPLRPEYVLTRRGAGVGRWCVRLVDAIRRARIEDVALRKWSMPVLCAAREARRFSELQEDLPPITARALALALKDLQGAGLLVREVEKTYPPRARYRAAGNASRGLVRLLDELPAF